MPAALPLKHPVKVGQLVRRRLRELKRTPRELAEAVQVSEDYIVDLVSGRRRAPPPGGPLCARPWARFPPLPPHRPAAWCGGGGGGGAGRPPAAGRRRVEAVGGVVRAEEGAPPGAPTRQA